jgi:hypothetical protein
MDFQEQMVINDLGIDRALRELDERLKSDIVRNVSKTEWHKDRNGRMSPVTVYDTVVVPDNTTRMSATTKLLELHGYPKSEGGPQVSVVILNAQKIEKPEGAGE